MSMLEFIAAVIGHIAWPATVVWIVLLLRKPIVELIPGLERLKYKEFELEFRKKIQELDPKRVTAINELPREESIPLLKPREYYANLASISSRAAILESWMEVEAAAAEAYDKFVPPGMKIWTNPREIFLVLRSKDILDEDDFTRSEELRKLRNKAAHQVSLHELDESLVSEYVNLALDLATKVKKQTAFLGK